MREGEHDIFSLNLYHPSKQLQRIVFLSKVNKEGTGTKIILFQEKSIQRKTLIPTVYISLTPFRNLLNLTERKDAKALKIPFQERNCNHKVDLSLGNGAMPIGTPTTSYSSY